MSHLFDLEFRHRVVDRIRTQLGGEEVTLEKVAGLTMSAIEDELADAAAKRIACAVGTMLSRVLPWSLNSRGTHHGNRKQSPGANA